MRKYRWLLAVGAVLPMMFPSSGVTREALKTQPIKQEEPTFQISNSIFKSGYSEQESVQLDKIFKAQSKLVVTRKAFEPSLAVVKKNEETIRKVAESKNFPPDLAIGVALLENGGSETAVSTAGATGVFQLIKGTASSMGLRVDDTVDERLIPERNIEGGVGYLAKNRELFSDPGLAVWAHHAGPQNVSKALREFSKGRVSGEVLTYVDAMEQKKLGETKASWQKLLNEGLDVNRLLQDPSTQGVVSELKDESSLYPYKVAAASAIFEMTKNKTGEEYTKLIEAFKQEQVSLAFNWPQ